MVKNVEVILEGFGTKNLRKVFPEEQVSGKNVGEIVGLMLNQKWAGTDGATYDSIMRKISTSSGNYTPRVARGGVVIGDPVKFLPARPEEKVAEYIQPTDLPNDQLRIAITPKHSTANKAEY